MAKHTDNPSLWPADLGEIRYVPEREGRHPATGGALRADGVDVAVLTREDACEWCIPTDHSEGIDMAIGNCWELALLDDRRVVAERRTLFLTPDIDREAPESELAALAWGTLAVLSTLSGRAPSRG